MRTLRMAVAFLSLLWVSVALPTAQGAPAAPSWSLLRTRNPLVPGGEFRSVSCPSVTSCVGVGYRIDIWGFEVSFAAIWDGTAWKFQETPNPPAASWTELWGVSCASATSCAAVGYYVGRSGENLPVAESWDGHRWKLQPTPPVSEGILLSVSCPSDIVCTTVGQYVNDRKWATLAEGWDGTAWTIQPTPNPPTAEDVNLTGVSCVSPSVCTAVGLDGEGGVYTALAEAWDGTAWTIQPTPHPQGMDGYLISVSCTAASACTGVGLDIGYGFALYALIERWDGTQWTIQSSPRLPDSVMHDVSCTTATECMAVGSYEDSSFEQAPLAERWDGTAWTVQPVPTPVGGSWPSLYGVSCLSPTACTAAGDYVGRRAAHTTLVETWDGTGWEIQPSANPPESFGGTLDGGVACWSATSCMSVGSHPDMNLDATLAERWDGTAWTIQSTPNPPGTYRELAAVSCPSATACTAVGHSFEEPGFVQRTLAEAWDGTRWWIQPTPDLPSHASLEGVSCTSDAACTAVGSYYDPGSATYATLAERWDGAAWTIQPTPNPSANSGLNAVSCTSETTCTAVGSSGSPGTTLAEAWDGASWSIEPMPSPQGEARLNGVSCPSATACTATGQYYDLGSGTYFTLAEGWDGAAWQIQPTPTPAHGATLAGVSCASSSACIAVGNYSLQGYGSGGPLAERWDGTAWTMELPIVPPGVKNASLAGVSCTAPTECIATGSYTPYYPGPSPTGTLAERYSG